MNHFVIVNFCRQKGLALKSIPTDRNKGNENKYGQIIVDWSWIPIWNMTYRRRWKYNRKYKWAVKKQKKETFQHSQYKENDNKRLK